MFKFLSLAIFLLYGFTLQAVETFSFNKGDVVGFMGNALADRMQHDAWTEALLQRELNGQQIRFRNLAISGDTVTERPRVLGFPEEDGFLDHIKADVLFLFYGYNESYANDPAGYQRDLGALIVKLKNQGRRLVVFSPIAFENTGDPNLPDGTVHNKQLAAYAEAAEKAAAEQQVFFVDLFAPTMALFESTSENLTINGIHLNEAGNKALAEMIASALLGKTVGADQVAGRLRPAIKDKNWHWHNRYRSPGGNDVWGKRSAKDYEGFTNAHVLQHENKMLDVMTANRDEVIWAAAQGQTIVADDSNVPPPIDVQSNVSEGKGKKLFGDYLSPEETIKTFVMPEGFKAQVFASEEMFPDLANPVQMQVDAQGRIWAACWNTYVMWEPLKEMNDSIMVFEDTDGDGQADKRTVFAEVHMPLGFEFWNGGVIATSGTDLLFLKDTDGDDVADVRYSMMQGFGTADTHHDANNLTFGPDGGIWFQSGVFLVNNWETPWGPNYHLDSEAGAFRFDPRTFTIQRFPHSGPNPHGIAFDYWGYGYFTSGTFGASIQPVLTENGFVANKFYNKRFRPVPSNAIISSQHLPEDLQGDFLTTNVIGTLGLHRYELNLEGDGKKVPLGTARAEYQSMLIDGKDRNFRPTDIVFGADGSMYVSDWHNQIIGHLQHNIREPLRDTTRGRIYRITVEGRDLQQPVAIADQPISALLENLKHPTYGVRHRSRVELSSRDSQEVVQAAQAWAAQFDPNDEVEAHHLLEAVWVHQQHNIKNQDLLQKLLGSSVPHAVQAAKVVDYLWNKTKPSDYSLLSKKGQKGPKLVIPKHVRKKSWATMYALGAKVYERESHCSTCHGDDGAGTPRIYPPLAGSKWVTGSDERLIKLVMHGLFGPITVKGERYDPANGMPPMTAFGDMLNDEEMAQVLTFVRNAWGNQAGPITQEQVRAVREATKDHKGFYAPDDLLKVHPMESAE